LKKAGYSEQTINAVLSKKTVNWKLPVLILITVLLLSAFCYILLIPRYPDICNDVSIKVYEQEDKPVICVSNDKSMIQLILKNNGKVQINSVEIQIISKTGRTEDIIKSPISPNPEDLVIRVIELDLNKGEVQQASITPVIVENNKEIKCRKISYSNIRTC
jgi:hypothetical protein